MSVSDDGRTFSEPVAWKFDDGSDLGNYNTQQHWVTHREALFLVYTRPRGEQRPRLPPPGPAFHRPGRSGDARVVRASEQVLVPEKGARLGNFGVTEVNETKPGSP